MPRAPLALVLAVTPWLVSACVAATKSPAGPADPGMEAGMADPAELRAELAVAIRESHRAISGGFEEAYLDGLSRDPRLVLIDVGPEDVVVGFDPVACSLRRQFEDRRIEIVSKALHVEVSNDGTVGWSSDELSYRVEHEGRRAIVPLRATGLYERRAGRWLLVQEHVSYGIPDDEALADPAFYQASKPLGDFVAPGRASEEMHELIGRLIADTDDTRVTQVSVAPGALMLGSDPDRELRGEEIAQAPTVRALYGYDREVSVLDLRVKASVTGTVAWAAANLQLTSPPPEGTAGAEIAGAPLPLRVTWVAVLDADGVWRVMQTHVSVGVARDTLSMRVFGETIAAAP